MGDVTKFTKDTAPKAGRPAGSKNKPTIFREACRLKTETKLLKNLDRIIDKTIQLADEGDSTCLKIIWDRVMPTALMNEKGQGNTSISITIEGMEKNVTIDGEYSNE